MVVVVGGGGGGGGVVGLNRTHRENERRPPSFLVNLSPALSIPPNS